MDKKGKQLAFGSVLGIVLESELRVAFVLDVNLCCKCLSVKCVAQILLRIMLKFLVCKKQQYAVQLLLCNLELIRLSFAVMLIYLL